MGPENEIGEKLKTKMAALPYKPADIFAQELEDELMKFTTNHEDHKVGQDLTKTTEGVHKDAEDEINITEHAKSETKELVEAEYEDATDSSSSFDGSDSEVENADTSGGSEALSDLHDDAVSALEFDESLEMFRLRKKKLTTHWRTFVQPLIWRCKWVELQIQKFQSQAQKYDRKLEKYSQQKQIQLENPTFEGLGARSLTFPRRNTRNEVLRRKKRKRTEATMDVTAYMSQHNLFSYYENKEFTEGVVVGDRFKNPANASQNVHIDDEFWINDEGLCIGPGDGLNSLENLLRKIEYLQSHVGKLKCRVDKVISETAGKFSCTDNLSLPLPCNTLVGSAGNTASPPNNGDRMPVGTYIASQLISEYNMGDVLMPESAVTSHGDGVPDVNGTTDHTRFGDAYDNGEVLIDNQRVKEEMKNFEEVNPIQSPVTLRDDPDKSDPPVAAEAEADPIATGQQPPKIRSIANLTARKNKRKRGKKGAGR